MKKFTTDNGSRCSGYGFYPDGRKCKGCSDCKGEHISTKRLIQQFNRNHSIIKVAKVFKSKKAKKK